MNTRLTLSQAISWLSALCLTVGAILFLVTVRLSMLAIVPPNPSITTEWYTIVFAVLGSLLAGGFVWLLWAMPLLIRWRFGHNPEQEGLATVAYLGTAAAVGVAGHVHRENQREKDAAIGERVRAALSSGPGAQR